MNAAPVILTLQFDAESTAFFEHQRQIYFPADINMVPAHLTLFSRRAAGHRSRRAPCRRRAADAARAPLRLPSKG
ncbi:MAG: hypothetical protein AcusKO_25820 [Acuticoccus sp.]